MALRFKRSVKICKGVKVNFGKTGASVSIGTRGAHKTFHTSGAVTTSVGIPGTGLYWTETTRRNTNADSSRRPSRQEYVGSYEGERSLDTDREEGSTNGTPIWMTENDDVDYNDYPIKTCETHADRNSSDGDENDDKQDRHFLSEHMVSELYKKCDETVEWAEINVGTSPEELMMDGELWREYKMISGRILQGDVDTYMDAIERFRPVDDLLLYGGDFEYGSDKGNYMEIEFKATPWNVLPQNAELRRVEEFVCSVCIRATRDIMALLPVSKVIIHAVIDNKTIMSIVFNKRDLSAINFNYYSATNIVQQFPYRSGLNTVPYSNVERFEC